MIGQSGWVGVYIFRLSNIARVCEIIRRKKLKESVSGDLKENA